MLSEISQRQRENDLTYMWILKRKKKKKNFIEKSSDWRWGTGVETLDKDGQKVQSSNCKITKSWDITIQPDDHS